MVAEEGEGLGDGHVCGVEEGVDTHLDVASLDDVKGNCLFNTREVHITESGVKDTATAAAAAAADTATITARVQDDRAIKRRACRDIAGGGRALLNPDGRAMIECQCPHDLVKCPMRTVLPVRARDKAPGAPMGERVEREDE